MPKKTSRERAVHVGRIRLAGGSRRRGMTILELSLTGIIAIRASQRVLSADRGQSEHLYLSQGIQIPVELKYQFSEENQVKMKRSHAFAVAGY